MFKSRLVAGQSLVPSFNTKNNSVALDGLRPLTTISKTVSTPTRLPSLPLVPLLMTSTLKNLASVEDATSTASPTAVPRIITNLVVSVVGLSTVFVETGILARRHAEEGRRIK